MPKRFAPDARRAITAAATFAGEFGHAYIGSEHYFVVFGSKTQNNSLQMETLVLT